MIPKILNIKNILIQIKNNNKNKPYYLHPPLIKIYFHKKPKILKKHILPLKSIQKKNLTKLSTSNPSYPAYKPRPNPKPN